MGRIAALFERKKHRVLNVYCTAGFPQLGSTLPVLKALQRHGADLVELGMPYSDPLADGPVIQASSAMALKNGMNLSLLLAQLKECRKEITLPLILMGYLNPLLQYGFEKFCRDASEAGVDGLIIPDIPLYSFYDEFQPVLKQYGLDLIFLVTPETPEDRIRQLDAASSGFLYAVSSSSTTGSGQDLSGLDGYLEKLEAMNLRNPVMVGFGIKDKESFDVATKHAAGAIIGSAYIKAIEKAEDLDKATKEFLEGIRERD